VDSMSELWTGHAVSNPCPKINSLRLADGDGRVETGATVRVLLDAATANGGPITVSWELHRDWFQYGTGGDEMPEAPQYPSAIVNANDREAELRMPREGGGYRLYAYVHDSHGGGAVANVSLFVNGPVPKPQFRASALPLVVYGDDQAEPPYAPSGWIGNTAAVGFTPDWQDNPHTGKTCMKLQYRDKSGWAGIIWQNPANDWGDKPGGRNLSGATALEFWARGETGGETVNFSFGGIHNDKPFCDSAEGKVRVALTKNWKQYSISLSGKNLRCIKSGFGWTVAAEGNPITFYVDDVRYE